VLTFLPTAGEYARALGGRPLVYYCVDDWAHSPDYDGARVARAEARLCQTADVVFATSRALVVEKQRWNARTHHAPHGVDHAHFARALDPALPVAVEVARLRRPVLAVVGCSIGGSTRRCSRRWRIAGPTGVSRWWAPCTPTWARSLRGPTFTSSAACRTPVSPPC
jgi:hypothetical protein